MIDKLKDRHNQMMLFFTIFIVILIGRMFILTIVQGEEYKNKADQKRIKKIPISAKRGEILDRYGRLLATNKASFTVQIMKNELIDEQINDISIKLLNILQKNDEKYNDNLPIIYENGEFYYTYDKEIHEWLNKNKYLFEGGEIPKKIDAKEVFEAIKLNLGIDGELDPYESQRIMQSDYNVYPPISVRNMKFIQTMKKEQFLQKYTLEEDLNAKDAFNKLKEKFKIPKEYSIDDTRKILIVRNELKDQGYRQYQPVEMAVNVKQETIVEIEEHSMDLPGVNIEVEPIRYYPSDNLGAHILGYLSKISDADRAKYNKKTGYKTTDLIGKSGIERKFEKELKGVDGAKYVEVDVYGRLVDTLRVQSPQKGKDVYLTIDKDLQMVAEKSLKKALEQIQVGGTFKSEFGDYKYRDAFRNATSGAVVALDAKTGEVLALANYPSYNPNLFTTGILQKDWSKLQDQNPRDPLSPVPLYNIATRTAVQPGSIFKMLTGLAAIEDGLDPSYKLYDGGFIKLGNKSYGCWLWNDYKRSHGWVDLYKALEVSCNYYFYDISTSWDYYKNRPLPIGVDVNEVLRYAELFGLGEKTGIEISELAYGVPNPRQKMETTKNSLRRMLNRRKKDFFSDELLGNQELLKSQIETIVNWIEENPSRGKLLRMVGELNLIEGKEEKLVDTIKYSYFNQGKWTKGDTFNLSIGQGQHAYTPIQMARYMSGLVNGGYKNNVTLIRRLGDEETEEKEKQEIDLKNKKNLDEIKKGMLQATQGEQGTGRTVFKHFPIKVGAKTGTAQKSGKIQPKDEVDYIKKYLNRIAPYISFETLKEKVKEYRNEYPNEGQAMRRALMDLSGGRVTSESIDRFKEDYDNFAWFVSYAPAQKPEIVVVALVFQGGHGGYASPIARDIYAEYFGLDRENDKFQFKNAFTK
ncbi:MAG: penicillin-binding transpeptidase domain-containing protein [Anaeromicrobium sp.]|jgi:penicillin-binding protein 2|uniref:penicillin-binding transpeptidase domain-containing protein n=1 Tax=Anaeromicrobium sp. TaxID=1929132 RepID=UPI0025E3875D|nr:penicillin-binding transpeptidase domain-containing protein [Anaeromicrobium sp.]MCT4594948.1 penicillin-binding transpeptidase domain-containing protein [Anaeromicrobium sp.]